MLPELFDQIPPVREIASVTAGGVFDNRKCHDAIAARGAAAIIPHRNNAKPCKPDTAGAIARNEILRTTKRVGRSIWRRWSGYHRRSRAETKMHCIKLLRQLLSARDFDRLVAECRCERLRDDTGLALRVDLFCLPGCDIFRCHLPRQNGPSMGASPTSRRAIHNLAHIVVEGDLATFSFGPALVPRGQDVLQHVDAFPRRERLLARGIRHIGAFGNADVFVDVARAIKETAGHFNPHHKVGTGEGSQKLRVFAQDRGARPKPGARPTTRPARRRFRCRPSRPAVRIRC